MNWSRSLPLLVVSLGCLAWAAWPVAAQKEPTPHGQDRPPGPALTPVEAIKKMTVPEGFTVELVAAEPDIVNPVAMTFDERGRIWITESLEYPRRSAGPGRDRVKVLESTKGDGRYDKVTVFAEGLNIPSGIAVGHGGVWVANAPDILFYKEGPDGKAAGKPEVVVTGFGRDDTHELPNSLTWGPDGWLYGLNGVFNPSHVKHQGKEFHFTCALFRIHPRTREFQLFSEGTSNPWGVAWDTEGSAFVSACVIDHLWHLTETGYYHRQGGPYPPFTWQLGSIVKHRHQKAAYCGIHFFDSDAYPPEYRERLYMGNIHGGCINVDVLAARRLDLLRQAGAGFPDRQRRLVHAGRAEDGAGRLPVHPRLVRPLSLLPGRQPRSQGHRSPAWPALPRPLQGHAAGRDYSTWPRKPTTSWSNGCTARMSSFATSPSGSWSSAARRKYGHAWKSWFATRQLHGRRACTACGA